MFVVWMAVAALYGYGGAGVKAQQAFDARGGAKMNLDELTLMRLAPYKTQLRVNGRTSAQGLLRKYPDLEVTCKTTTTASR